MQAGETGVIDMTVQCFAMTGKDRLLCEEHEAWSDFSEELLEKCKIEELQIRESICINGVRYIKIKQTHVCRKRLIEIEDLTKIKMDSEVDRYWEWLQNIR